MIQTIFEPKSDVTREIFHEQRPIKEIETLSIVRSGHLIDG